MVHHTDDSAYIKQLTENYKNWKSSCSFANSSILWEYLKYKIRFFTINYSKEIARKKPEKLIKLEKEMKELELFVSTNDVSSQAKYFDKKSELEKIYDYITEGIIIRSRTVWYEQGERNSKYFLNLEKRQKSKTQVRKLLSKEVESQVPQNLLIVTRFWKNVLQYL